MQSNFKKINNLFAYLVEKSTAVEKFISVSERELQNALSKTPKIEDPFLVLFGYEGKLDGNNQRTTGTRTVSFAVLFRISDPNNYTDQYEKINQAEEIGLQFLSRINYESKSGEISWLHNAFRKESVRFTEITYQTPNGLFGCEFHFDIDVKNPLIADSKFWKDKDFCTS